MCSLKFINAFQHHYSIQFLFLFSHIPLSNSYVVNGANVGNAVLKFDLEGNYLGEVGFPSKSWRANSKKFIQPAR